MNITYRISYSMNITYRISFILPSQNKVDNMVIMFPKT